MPRVTPAEELNLVESIVAGHPNGLGISAIEAEIERRLATQRTEVLPLTPAISQKTRPAQLLIDLVGTVSSSTRMNSASAAPTSCGYRCSMLWLE